MNLTDPRQLALFHSRDRKTFDRVFNACENAIFLIAWGILQHSGEAEDVVAEMRERLWTYQGTFNDFEHIKAFLRKATRNRCLDLLRKQGRGTIKIGGYDHLPDVADVDETRELFNDKVEEQVYTLMLTAVLEEMQRIPKQRREIAQLCIIDGKSVKEAAGIMKITKSTAYSHLTKARELLREALKDFKYLLMVGLMCLWQYFF